MAIQFARVERVGRSSGKTACCKSAYNAREVIKDQTNNIVYAFKQRGGNEHHEILLPEHVHASFKQAKVFANAVEGAEKRKDAQLFKEYVLALPDEKNVSLHLKVEMVKDFIEANGFVKEGLGVQMDIHSPHNDDSDAKDAPQRDGNWHAHLLVTTRRFQEDGISFGPKARDLEPQVRGGVKAFINGHQETNLGALWRDVQNQAFERYGMENRVDAIHPIAQVHLGPRRMRDLVNDAILEHEMRHQANQVSLSNGDDLLQHITERASVFSKDDMLWSMKFLEDDARKNQLLQDALKSEQIITLQANGEETGLFTTKEVRSQEERTLRYANKIHGRSHHHSGIKKQAIQKVKDGTVSFHQGHVLRGLCGSDGIKIVEGRAGTGKSYVLGQYREIRQNASNPSPLIGLAPTHKAVNELKAQGFEDTSTLKGFLFDIENGKRSLKPSSTLLVDEAGMVGTETYQELFRVASQHGSEVILVGDSKQLPSVERGGMFAYLSKEYGSLDLSEVRRQKHEWGKEVGLSFAKGHVAEGIKTLKRQDKFSYSSTVEDAVSELAQDWTKSAFDISERQILAVSNKQVDILNQAIRCHLKEAGHIGEEVFVSGANGGHLYGANDRIVMTQTDKSRGLQNGDFGIIESITKDSMSVMFDDGNIRIFSPEEAQFKHGYASTVYKAQGASIKDVYVYHGGFSGRQNAYVEMSRHVEDLHLYANKEDSRTEGHVIAQMGRCVDRGASLQYTSESDTRGLLGKVGAWIQSKAQAVGDAVYQTPHYYVFEGKEQVRNKVSDVIQDVSKNVSKDVSLNVAKDMASKGQDNTPHQPPYTDPLLTKKEMVQEITDLRDTPADDKVVSLHKARQTYQDRVDKIRSDLKIHASTMALMILGEDPNKHLSNNRTYRFGEKGALAIEVAGPKAGIWHDFRDGNGGDLLSLIQREKGMDFKESLTFAEKGCVENASTPIHQMDRDLVSKAEKGFSLDPYLKKSTPISFYKKDQEVPHRYFKETRGISVESIPKDIRYMESYFHKEGQQHVSALLCVIRDTDGNAQGVQTIALGEDGKKADMLVPKRSHGKVKGGHVVLQESSSHLTILTEGIETGLSLKEAGLNANIKAVLGIHNFKHYVPKEGEQIIIAGDHDANQSRSNQTLDKALSSIKERGAGEVLSIQPQSMGDFNDVLQKEGAVSVRDHFKDTLKELSLTQTITPAEKTGFLNDHKDALQEHKTFYPKEDISDLMGASGYLLGKEHVEGHIRSDLGPALHKALTDIDAKYHDKKAHAKSFKQYLYFARQEQKEVVPLLENHPISQQSLKQDRQGFEFLYHKKKDYMKHQDIFSEGKKMLDHGAGLGLKDDATLLKEAKQYGLGHTLESADKHYRHTCLFEAENALHQLQKEGVYETKDKAYKDTISYLKETLDDPHKQTYLSSQYGPVLKEQIHQQEEMRALELERQQEEHIRSLKIKAELREIEQRRAEQLEVMRRTEFTEKIAGNYAYLKEHFRKIILKSYKNPDYVKEHGIKGPGDEYYGHHAKYMVAISKDQETLDQMDKNHPIYETMQQEVKAQENAKQREAQRQLSRGMEMER